MGILDKLEKVEKKLQKIIELRFGENSAQEPLEIRRKVLEDIEEKMQALGRKNIFPFNYIEIHLFAPDESARAIYQSAFTDPAQFDNDIRHLLHDNQCDISEDFEVQVQIDSEASPDLPALAERGFFIRYERREKPKEEKPSRPEALVTVTRGRAKQKTLRISAPKTNIGRLSEVIDMSGRVVRRNELAFLDMEDNVNSTVSRSHAHIYLEVETGDFRLCDDGSVHGTHIVRDGRTIEVPTGNPRGTKLQSGDELYLGQACLLFESQQTPGDEGELKNTEPQP
ncbi:MAG TPA: FHA domain-containing protein [Acidobacteriota bacterium]|jgi:hypothetical protein